MSGKVSKEDAEAMTVVQLRDLLRKRKRDTKGRKAELVERVTNLPETDSGSESESEPSSDEEPPKKKPRLSQESEEEFDLSDGSEEEEEEAEEEEEEEEYESSEEQVKKKKPTRKNTKTATTKSKSKLTYKEINNIFCDDKIPYFSTGDL